MEFKIYLVHEGSLLYQLKIVFYRERQLTFSLSQILITKLLWL